MPKPKGLSEERIKRVTLKIDEDGRTVTAKFATLGVRDLDGDIIEAGAIGEQNVFLGAWNHDQRTLPPGVGTTYESKDAALFRGNFLDTTSGRDHYETLKAADGLDSSLMEWSFRFFVTEGAYELQDEEESFIIRKARVTHVAPVESGAGIDTRTVDIKCVGCEAKTSQPEVPTCTHCGAKAGHEQAAADTTSIDYEKLATAVATAVVTAMSQSPKGGCGGGCGGGKGVAQKGDTLGSLIRTLRDEKELTNDDLAEAAGVSVSTIGQILGGTLVCPRHPGWRRWHRSWTSSSPGWSRLPKLTAVGAMRKTIPSRPPTQSLRRQPTLRAICRRPNLTTPRTIRPRTIRLKEAWNTRYKQS